MARKGKMWRLTEHLDAKPHRDPILAECSECGAFAPYTLDDQTYCRKHLPEEFWANIHIPGGDLPDEPILGPIKRAKRRR